MNEQSNYVFQYNPVSSTLKICSRRSLFSSMRFSSIRKFCCHLLVNWCSFTFILKGVITSSHLKSHEPSLTCLELCIFLIWIFYCRSSNKDIAFSWKISWLIIPHWQFQHALPKEKKRRLSISSNILHLFLLMSVLHLWGLFNSVVRLITPNRTIATPFAPFSWLFITASLSSSVISITFTMNFLRGHWWQK